MVCIMQFVLRLSRVLTVLIFILFLFFLICGVL